MNWDAIGAIGELLGALVVVLSLGYVAIQIRQNTLATRQQSYHNIVSRRSEFLYRWSVDRETTTMFVNGMTGPPEDSIDSQRFVAFAMNLMSHFQDVYLQYFNGIVEEHVWRAERNALAATKSAAGFADWWTVGTQYFLPEFVAEVDKVEPIDLVTYDFDNKRWAKSSDLYAAPNR